MSLKALLEVASVQSNALLFAQTLEEALTEQRLNVSVEPVNGDAVKVSIAHATAQETATLINNLLDMANASNLKVEVFEGACQSCAYLALTEDQVSSLESAALIEIAERSERPIDEDDEDPEENFSSKSDSDVGEEDDEDEDEELDKEIEDDDDRLKILNNEETFKLVSRLHGIACGNNKQDFHNFLSDVDSVLNNYRNRSGYDGAAETASTDDFISYVLASFDDGIEETAKGRKGKIKKGRAGFLSAYMKLVGKASDDLAIAWDHLDTNRMQELLSEVGAKLLEQIDEERIKQGLDKPPKGGEDEVETDEQPESFEGANIVKE